jgi:hypothetical protein
VKRLEITPSGIRRGIWHGTVRGSGASPPGLRVTLLGERVPGVAVEPVEGGDGWHLTIPIPAGAITEGLQTFLILDDTTGETLHNFGIVAGQALGEDMRLELELLRAELDMLKQAFRRHCSGDD